MTPTAEPKRQSVFLTLVSAIVSGATRALVRWLLDWAISA